MEVKKKTVEETIYGAEKEMEFEINTDTHIIFEILRDKMYSDKIGAVCREIASNSRDANREAGRKDVPITIEIVKPHKFASIGHTTIVFHDNGIGITPDRMADVFIKYASSTKNDSNEQTGGFGLGAKTPFAYSDTFTVVTVCDWAEPIYETRKVQEIISQEQYDEDLENGVAHVLPEGDIMVKPEEGEVVILVKKTEVVGYHPEKRMEYTYNAIIDESNKGKMVLFTKEETTEDTGTKIVVPIKNDSDRHQFEKKSMYYTQFWGKGVEYKGFYKTVKDIDYVIDEKKFAIVKMDTDASYGLLIDGINYPLNQSEVGINDSGVGSNYTILLRFETGELTISANREAVQYDEETVTAIKKRIEHIKDRISALTQKYIKTLPTYYEACKFSYYMFNAKSAQRDKIEDDYLRTLVEAHNSNKNYYHEQTILSNDRKRFKDMKFKGRELKTTAQLKYHSVCLVKQDWNGKSVYGKLATLNIDENIGKLPIYYADTRKDRRRNETIWETDKKFFLILPRGDDNDKQARLDEFNEFITDFDLDFSMYSDVEKKKIAHTGGGGRITNDDRSKVSILYRTGVHNDSRNLLVDRKSFEVTKMDGSPMDTSKMLYYVVDSLKEANYILYDEKQKMRFLMKEGDYKIIVVNEPAHRNWISKSKIKDMESVYKKLSQKYIKKWLLNSRMEVVLDCVNDVLPIGKHTIANLEEELWGIFPNCVQDALKHNKVTEDTSTPNYLNQEVKFDRQGLKKKLKFLMNVKYPMLMPYIANNTDRWNGRLYNSKDVKKNVKQYIKLVSNG